MKARIFYTGVAAAAGLAVWLGANAQNDEVSIEATDLGGGVWMLVGQGGNIGISTGEDGVLMIDDQFERLSETILAKVDELSGGEELKYVLNTHYHGDHTGGNAAMTAAGGTIVAHDNVRLRLAGGDEPSPAAALPVITYSDHMTVHWNGHEMQVHYLPNAHTDGDSLVYIPDLNVIHTGDTLFNTGYPYIDLAGGGSVDGYIAALETTATLADEETQIIPGHGPLATRADVVALAKVLKGAKAAVAALVDDGMSLEEVKAADPLAEWNGDYSWGFISGERMTETIYNDITG